MNDIKTCILSIALAAIGCGVIQALVPQKGSGRLLKLLCGFYLLLVMCRVSLDPAELELPNLGQYRQEAEALCRQTEESIHQEMAAVIRQETETYIENKATGLGVALTATVTLGPDLTPQAVVIKGDASAYVRQRLSDVIQEDLNIPGQWQVWTS